MKKINPNVITSVRFFICAPLACFFLIYGCLALALAIMILGEITDALDGYVARKTGQISNLGKIYDPMCDSIFHMVIWISFLAIGWVPIYLVLVFFVRDCVVSNIRICLASHRIVLSARTSGKIKAIAQATAQISLVVLHIFISGSALKEFQLLIVWSAAIVTVYSLFDYSRRFWQVVKEKGLLAAG